MDTVEPSKNKRAVETEDGRLQSAGEAVLGADDVTGIVEILEGIRSVREDKKAHRDIEILFSPAEEIYGKGSSLFDYRKIKAKEAYVLDMSGKVGSAVVERFRRVCKKQGLSGKLVKTFGGSDNNSFARHGILGLVLSCGMYQVHSAREYTKTEDLLAGARLVAGLVTDEAQ